MTNISITQLTTKTCADQSGQSFKHFFIICTDLAPICTDLYRNLQMFADLPATRPMMQPSYTAATYANSTVIKTTQRAWIPRARSVKTRRKPLSDNKLYLQMHNADSTWNDKTMVNGRTKPNMACLCYRPRDPKRETTKRNYSCILREYRLTCMLEKRRKVIA